MPTRRVSRRRANRNTMTIREFNECRRNLTFEQCDIIQWSRRSTRIMMHLMMTWGVYLHSPLFHAHRQRHEILRVFLRLGVRPYADADQVLFNYLTIWLQQSWRRCEIELARL
ncbi:hypothetical protein L3Y34_012652 [Caenorhabditis briggsae]|uniref:Uncharacterized protein n=1 Tax=Caenorhabditis briggsae TaxID=6238 RepID=A0AAE8ZZK6_CAEBR|nr:hypothetical protein L3Y34_012652 [Caenorhabditis briggsae]